MMLRSDPSSNEREARQSNEDDDSVGRLRVWHFSHLLLPCVCVHIFYKYIVRLSLASVTHWWRCGLRQASPRQQPPFHRSTQKKLQYFFEKPTGRKTAAKKMLARRAQTSTESCVLYVENWLSGRRKAYAEMPEVEKVGHVLKGIFSLLTRKNYSTVNVI